jgi:hypothetical protein
MQETLNEYHSLSAYLQELDAEFDSIIAQQKAIHHKITSGKKARLSQLLSILDDELVFQELDTASIARCAPKLSVTPYSSSKTTDPMRMCMEIPLTDVLKTLVTLLSMHGKSDLDNFSPKEIETQHDFSSTNKVDNKTRNLSTPIKNTESITQEFSIGSASHLPVSKNPFQQ